MQQQPREAAADAKPHGELHKPRSEAATAEQCLLDALRLTRNRRALSFELRTGMSLARLWAANGRSDDALELLTSIYSRFLSFDVHV